MRPVLFWELKRNRTALLWWALGSVLLTALIIALYPSIRDQANQLNGVINQLPKELRGLKTGGAASVNVADPIEFLNSQLFYATLPILWIIWAITRASKVLARDEDSHVIELSASRAISRAQLLTAKFAAYMVEAMLLGLTAIATLLILCPLVQLDVPASRLLLATLYTLGFSVAFGAISVALYATGRFSMRAASSVVTILSFGGYILASLESLTDWLKWPAKAAPFHYFKPLEVLQGHTPVALTAFTEGAFVLSYVVAIHAFHRRDLR